MALTSDYESYDMVNRMERAIEFLKDKEQIQELTEKVSAVQHYLEKFNSLNDLMKHFKDLEKNIYVCKDMFTPEEAAKYLGVSLSHLYRLTSKNEITKYKPSGKLMYLAKVDLNQWMMSNEIPSNERLESLAHEKAEELRKERINSKLKK